MRVLITGSSGFVGSALTQFLAAHGHKVFRLVRRTTALAVDEILWNPEQRMIDAARLEGLDAVVHLAGDNLASGRWTEAKKARIRNSRVDGTLLLSETLAGLRAPPKVLASASAVGYYGSRGAEILSEGSPAGTDFLARVCQEWEGATRPAERAGIRVVHCRFGLILGSHGGALKRMVPVFRAGLGGVLGPGEHYWSWIALEDVVRGIDWVLRSDAMTGPANFVSPLPVTNREFTKTLGAALSRPTVFRVPRLALRLAFGEMADETLLASTRVEPRRLLAENFPFAFSDLRRALNSLLARD